MAISAIAVKLADESSTEAGEGGVGSLTGMVPSKRPALTKSTLRKRSFLSESNALLRCFEAHRASSASENLAWTAA
jgi:hypothetical protein